MKNKKKELFEDEEKKSFWERLLEGLGDLLVEIILFGIGAGVLLLLGVGIDFEKVDMDLIILIGVAVLTLAGLLIFCAVKLVGRKRKREMPPSDAEACEDAEMPESDSPEDENKKD